MKRLTIQDIERMSEKQLRSVGKDLYITGADSIPVDDLENLVKRCAGMNISIPKDEPLSAAKPKAAKPKEKETNGRERVWFKIMPDQRAGDAPVFAALQGNAIMVHRNAWVPLPTLYLPCFKDAVETVVTTLKDGSTKTSDVPRYNYQIQKLTDIDTPPDGGAVDGGF